MIPYRPLPFTWPLGAAFWGAWAWSFWPEIRIVREARRAQRGAEAVARDPSYRPLISGQRAVLALAMVSAILAPRLAIQHWRVAVYVVGIVVLVLGSVLRRHCFRMLGADFRGAVTVRPDQPVVERGAYRLVRHPSYAAALLMHIGFALALGNWGTLAIVLLGMPPLFMYRIRVEEHALVERLGAPYASYMTRTHRLVPGLW